jgi:polynucleotide 5'-kinase involved in rRNA processing
MTCDLVRLFFLDDIVPYEIKARGPDAIRHFQTACDTGTTSVRRTLLLLVGPKSSGKTCLKDILVNDNDLHER